MKRLISVAFMAAVVFGNAQENILLRGFVYDKDADNTPLGMAIVLVKNTQLGGLTDDNGYFEIPIPKMNLKDSVRVSYVGYQTQMVSVSNYKAGDTLRIFVSSSIEQTKEAVITGLSAKGVLQRAIQNMKGNLFYDSLIATGFYRQYHKENGTYVRLIEADVSVAFNIKSPYKYSVHEYLRVNKQRRSENYERNVDANNHGDHFVDLLKENPYSYNRNNFLDVKKLDFYSPKIAAQDSVQYIISLQYRESSSEHLEQAKVWVEKGTFAMTRMEIEKYPNPNYVPSRYAIESRWKLVNEKDVIETEKVEGKYVVSSMVRSYNHHVVSLQTGYVESVVEETFELYFDDYNTESVGEELRKGNFRESTNFYTSVYKYDADFWNTYDLPEDYPLKREVRTDLEHAKPLDVQFGAWAK